MTRGQHSRRLLSVRGLARTVLSTISGGRCYDCELGCKRLTRHISSGREKMPFYARHSSFLFLVVTSGWAANRHESSPDRIHREKRGRMKDKAREYSSSIFQEYRRLSIELHATRKKKRKEKEEESLVSKLILKIVQSSNLVSFRNIYNSQVREIL